MYVCDRPPFCLIMGSSCSSLSTQPAWLDKTVAVSFCERFVLATVNCTCHCCTCCVRLHAAEAKTLEAIAFRANPVEQLSLERLSLERMSLERLSLERLSLERLSLERMSLTRIPFE